MIKMKPIPFILAALLLLSTCGCARHEFVEPTGWRTLSPTADSLTRAIELSFQNGVGADSTMAIMKVFREQTFNGEDHREAEARLLYWQGRIEIRRQNRKIGHLLLDSASSVADGDTKEYIGRMNDWRREQRADYSAEEWYVRKLDQARYFDSRNDRQMLYNVYRELMELMRDVGLNDRAMHYLDLITECNRAIDPGMAVLDDKMNRAAILSDMGKDTEAAALNRELQLDSAYMKEPINFQLVNMNLCNLTGDTAALHSAYSNILQYGDRADLLPKVYFYLAEKAIGNGDCISATRWADSLTSMLPEMDLDVSKIKVLKAIARVNEMCAGPEASMQAYRQYAFTADSITELLRSDNVANLELSRAIEETDALLAQERRAARIRVWIIATVACVLAMLGAWLLLRWRRKTLRLRKEAEKMKTEAEHKRIALQLDADRRGLGNEIGTDNFLELFTQQYPLFISRLRQIAPRISDTALRLAGYIAIGLSTKEIADLMNVRPESVRQSKWRLRKTLGRESEEDLFPLLSSLLHGEHRDGE